MLKRVLVLSLTVLASAALFMTEPARAELQDILDKGVVRIGVPVDVPPFGFVDNEQKPAGLDVDIARRVAEELGVELELQQITGINRVPYLMTDKVDIVIAVMGATPERAKQIAFTSPYASLYIGVFGPADAAVDSADDLAGFRIGVPRGTTQDISVTEMAPSDAEIVRFEDDATSAAAYLSGQVDLIATANIVAQELAEKNPGKDFTSKFVIRFSPAHMGIRQGQPDLLRWLDTFIFYSKMSGSLDEVSGKWMGEPMQDLPSM